MRYAATGALSVVLLGIIAVSGMAESDEAETRSVASVAEDLAAGRPVTIVAFGDSITGVYYHTGGRRAWADMLKVALEKTYPKAEITMVNAGISGHTSAQGLARIERDVLSKKPDLVVVMFGMNDVARNSIDEFEKNLREIIRRCRAAGAAVVLSTPNSVYENPGRPTARLAEFAQRVREVAKEERVPLADSYAAYEAIRGKDPNAWRILMSETIHPNMNGHKVFAEVMAEAISGKPVSLEDAQPPQDSLRFTLANLRAGKPVTVVAPAPYDTLLPKLLKERFPDAQIKTVSWPMKDMSLAQIEQWAGKIRGLHPTLVVFAIPSTVDAASDEEFIRKSMWTLALCSAFGQAQWDVLPILPGVAGEIPPAKKRLHETFAPGIAGGCDYPIVRRNQDDDRSAEEILRAWIDAAM